MLSAYDVNLNVLSGVHAMMSSILSTTEPGDLVMTVPLEYGFGCLFTEDAKNDLDVQRFQWDAVLGARFEGKSADELVAQVDDGIFSFACFIRLTYFADTVNLRSFMHCCAGRRLGGRRSLFRSMPRCRD